MTEGQLRDAVRSLDGRLDDVRREQAWRRVERELTTPVQPPARRWRWPVAGLAMATAAALVIAWLARAPHAVDDAPPATALVAEAGKQSIYQRDGVSLTLVGPGTASVHERAGTLYVHVDRGTLLADRTDDAPPLAIDAAGNTTTTRDRRFTVRVQPGTVVFGAGDHARALVQRDELVVTPPAPAPAPAPAPPIPPPPPAKPRVERAPVEPAVVESPARAPELPPIVVTAPELYARAEAALRVRDPAAARTLLERVIAEYPADPLADAAHYDLALIAIEAGDRDAALAHTRALESARDPNLKAAAAKLRARIR
ncbi:MAG TPA: tetratricopeptide repeat protein [Kofleriaceae bacterium]|nr:tetratricopeptide repeat protein [Kofleriaceae bacterium]